MNKSRCLAPDKIGFASGIALLGALTGCTTYVDQPRSQGGYYQEPPPVREVYVPPPSVRVESPAVSAEVMIRTEDDFYEPLSPYGRWAAVGSYRRCWIPGRVEANWRPYSNGNWQRTEAGWYWASDEPWAWACYHYGWWFYDPVQAWIWVPGIEWAPAWVSWRFGGGYCGWAPLTPHGVIVAPSSFVFVEVGHFHQPVRPSNVIVNNTAIINKTTIVNNNIRQETRTIAGSPQKVMFNEGPGLAPIQKASGKIISAVPIDEAVRQTPVPRTVSRKATEPSGKEKAPVATEQTKPTQERPPASVTPQPPKKSVPPDQGHPPSKDRLAPAPAQPQSPQTPFGKPQGPPKGKGKKHGKGQAKDPATGNL